MKINKIIIAFISLLAAVCLWAYVVTVVNPDGETVISNIPVVFSGQEVLQEDHSLVIVGSEVQTVTVQFSGKNTDMKKLEQNRDQLKAVVDVSKVRSTRDYTYSYELSLPSAVQASAVEIVEQNPPEITFSVENYITRNIEVQGDFTDVSVAEGYMLEETSFSYETVQVEGPESVVSQIVCARVPVSRSNLSKTVSQTLNFILSDAEGKTVDRSQLKLETEEVEVTLSITRLEEIPLDVSFIDGGGATGRDVTYRIDPPAITLAGDSEVFDGLNKIDLGNIDLSEIAAYGEILFPILIPNGAKNIANVEEAVVTLEIKNRPVKTLTMEEFDFVGVQDGLVAKNITKRLQITVRASENDIGHIGLNRLQAIADMSGFTQPGMYTVPVNILINGYPNAGVVGAYSITVSVEEYVEPEPEPEDLEPETGETPQE